MTVLSKDMSVLDPDLLTTALLLKQLSRNTQAGAAVGLIFVLLQVRRLYYRHKASTRTKDASSGSGKPPTNISHPSKVFPNAKNAIKDEKHDKVHWLFNKSTLANVTKEFLRYPAYFFSFSLLFKLAMKCLIMLKTLKQNPNKSNKVSVSSMKLLIAVITCILGYLTQYCFNVFGWNFAVLIFLRSFLGLLTAVTPDKYVESIGSEFGVTAIWTAIHASLPFWLGYRNTYIPWNFWKVLERSLGERQETWYHIYGNHKHNRIPPCYRLIHLNPDHKSCLKSLIYDSFPRVYTSVTFYVKFFVIANLLRYGLLGFLKELWRRPGKIVGSIGRNVLGCTGFFYFGLHFVTRIACLNQWVMRTIYKMFYTEEEMKYKVICGNNAWFLFVVTGIVGWMGIKCEVPSRRKDYCMVTLWKIIEQIVRTGCNLESKDMDSYHWMLGSIHFSSALMALNCFTLFSAYGIKPQAIKSLERMLIERYLLR